MAAPLPEAVKSQARALRTTQDLSIRLIAAQLGVSKSAVGVAVADIPTEASYFKECRAAGCFVRFTAYRHDARYCSRRCGERERRRVARGR